MVAAAADLDARGLADVVAVAIACEPGSKLAIVAGIYLVHRWRELSIALATDAT